jgi:hypothetical protein
VSVINLNLPTGADGPEVGQQIEEIGEETMGNWEDLAVGGSLLAAIFAVMTLHNIKAPAIAEPALAAEAPVVAQLEPEAMPASISFTVTGKRLPKECKGTPASDEVDARCEALRDQTRVTVNSASK